MAVQARPFTAKKHKSRGLWSRGITPYVLLAPALLFVVGLLGYAVISGFSTSLYRVEVWSVDRPYVGLDNYARLFRDPRFLNAVGRSFIFVGGTIVCGFLLSLGFALTLQQVKRFRGVFRALALVPYLVSGIATAVMWRFLFVGSSSLVNHLSASLGLGTFPWLADPNGALVVVTLANIWFISPFSTLILLSGLQTIDSELYEAAALDGARVLQRFWYITLPSIAPMTALSLMWLSFASFNMFDIILPLTGGGPGRATEVLAVYMYRLAFRDLNYSSAAAVMMMLLVINVTFSIFYLRIFRER